MKYVAFVKGGSLSNLCDHKRDIWIVECENDCGDVTLHSIRDERKKFVTPDHNLIDIEYIKANRLFNKENFIEAAYDKYMHTPLNDDNFKDAEFNNKIVENEPMNKTSNTMVARTTDANVNAAKVAATIATGRTINSVMINKFKSQIPMLVRGYADSPLGAVVIANMVDFGVKQFAADNAKFNYVSDAMMQAAMVDLLAEFDFEGIMNDVLNGVTLGDIAD